MWLQHAIRNQPWQMQRQVVGLAALGLFIAILMGALYLAQSTSNATLGRRLEELIAQRNQLEQTNEQLRSEIAQLRSVPRLLARAKDLGFVESGNQNIEYLVVPGYDPRRDEVTPLALGAEATPAAPVVYDENLLGWLQQQWDAFTGQLQGFSEGTK